MRIRGRSAKRVGRFADRHDARDHGMPGASLIVRRTLSQVISLFANVRAKFLHHRLAGRFLHEPDVDGRRGAVGNDRPCACADECAGHAAHVERRILERELQFRKRRLRSRDAERAQHRRRVVGNAVEHRALLGSERRDAVVEACDQHPSIIILHRREQQRQPLRGIRNPVAVIAAVDADLRAEHREVHARDPARTIRDGGTSARMLRTVEDHHQVRRELVAVLVRSPARDWVTPLLPRRP